MPLSSTPNNNLRPPNWNIPTNLRHLYSACTQRRHAFADWAVKAYRAQRLVHPRRALISHLRATGELDRNGRLTELRYAEFNFKFGTLTMNWLIRSGTIPLEEFLHVLRSTREASDPSLGEAHARQKRIDNPLPPPTPLASEPEEDLEVLLRRDTYARNQQQRLAFAQYLDQREGQCRPRATYLRWRKDQIRTPHVAYLGNQRFRRYRNVANDIRDTLGPTARTLIDTLGNTLTDRHELADQLRSIR